MVALVFAIMASAMQRMVLYQREFGLTVDRFFASAAMAGIAVTLAWLVFTVLRGASQRFAGGFLVAWAAWLLLLNIANPERIIVESNLARIGSGAPLDIDHLARLHGDAVPAIVAGLDRLTAADRSELLRRLEHKDFSDGNDWRAWHMSRSRAARLLRQVVSQAAPTLGAEQHVCTDTCQLGYRVTALHSLSRQGNSPDARLWAVVLTARFDPAAVLSNQSPAVTLTPAAFVAKLADAEGRVYVATAESQFQFSGRLAPGESRDVTLVYELPAGAVPAELLVNDIRFRLPDA
jgi:hypothetical protein